MRRLTKKDWDTINSALALYEAAVEAGEFDDPLPHVRRVRGKVHERL